MKTESGKYNFIVTAKENRTADHFSFDCKATCIPIVSSTGHGHASIRRLHYVEGKFALANIMCAIIVKREDVLIPKYLFYILSAMKDEVISSLMTGTSNVSLNKNDLYDIEIPLPKINEQLKFVKSQDIYNQKVMKYYNEITNIEKILLDKSKGFWKKKTY
ncbi:MAG TPA: hypothetical protein EYO18_06310 [Candidatus Marinimicrobia bacterium]|nr:hypothetical protein [Candidatus Neomarinimicrobiota bacterium]